ncbi:MAG TPA: NAD(P)-binding domain-containing protein [Terracidiphilus sp.]|jgi:predicted dinucleotide-binding enzyme|nr:NAD(P)-binding domain-containing protein [Terracidiphilus sp.]
MKVGVLGSGDVAKVLAAGFLKHGHAVTIGSRTPAKLADWAKQHHALSVSDFAGAAASGELLVLAVKGNAAAEVLRLAESKNLSGKTVMDACNPIADAPPEHGVLRFFTTHTESLMEQLQNQFPDAHFVKAYNSVGNACMINPQFAGGMPTMFICGNNEQAKQTVAKINEQFGWETADLGTVEAARAIEPLCMLWCISGFLHNDWFHAFKLLKK